jgi:hypothetical protein
MTWVRWHEPENGQPENITEQAERPTELKVSPEVWISVARSGPGEDRNTGSAENGNSRIRFRCNGIRVWSG